MNKNFIEYKFVWIEYLCIRYHTDFYFCNISVTIPKYLLKPSFDCFLTCSILKVISNINVSNFGLHFKGFTLPTIYISEITFLLMCLTNTYFWQLFEQVVKELKCSSTRKRCGAF